MARCLGAACCLSNIDYGCSFIVPTQVEVDYVEREVSISGYPLSAALTCAKVCSAFEQAWGIQ